MSASAVSNSNWESTAVQNLVRYRPSGTYYARFRVGGKLVWKSLETTVFSVAKQRLPDTIREHRANGESGKAFTNGKMTVNDAAVVYLAKVNASVSLKPRSKGYREMFIGSIRRSWPALFETDVRKVSERDCEEWLGKDQRNYAPTVIDNSIGTLRAVFDEAVSAGARFNNPAADLSREGAREAAGAAVMRGVPVWRQLQGRIGADFRAAHSSRACYPDARYCVMRGGGDRRPRRGRCRADQGCRARARR